MCKKLDFSSRFSTIQRLALTVLALAFASLHSASALNVVGVTADSTFRPVDVDGLGRIENLQLLTVRFSEPVHYFGALDTFSYNVYLAGNSSIFMQPSYASITGLPWPAVLPEFISSVNLWFNGTDWPGNKLEYNTLYRLHIFNLTDANGIDYLESIPDFQFRTLLPTSVPEPSGMFALVVAGMAGILAYRRRVGA